MGKCGCSGGSCSCKIIAGRGVKVRGSGAQNNPIIIDAYPISMAVQDSSTVDMTLSGAGTQASPWVISADISDVGTAGKWKLWEGSQTDYDALGSTDSETLYAITSE